MSEDNKPGPGENDKINKTKDTVADLGAAAAGAAGGAKDTVADLGAAAAGAAATAGQASDAVEDHTDGVPPKMPDGPSRSAAQAEPDEISELDSDTGSSATDTDASSGLGSLMPANAAAAESALAEEPLVESSQPPRRYDLERNHRVAADLTGRTKTQREFNQLSRRSFFMGATALALGFGGWKGVNYQNENREDRIPDALREIHQANESIWRGLFRDGAEAPLFDFEESSMMRINGRHGIQSDLNMATWQLNVVGRNGEMLGTHSLDELRDMEQVELTVEHKCVEGWAHIVTWGGVRFSDFVERFYPEQAQADFVGLATPDNEYRVGLDMDSMLHSQTLLALDLQREPLDEGHGAPVRLATPLKYGIKQIKRIGTIEFSDTQPLDDYWTLRGYDWYAGL